MIFLKGYLRFRFKMLSLFQNFWRYVEQPRSYPFSCGAQTFHRCCHWILNTPGCIHALKAWPLALSPTPTTVWIYREVPDLHPHIHCTAFARSPLTSRAHMTSIGWRHEPCMDCCWNQTFARYILIPPFRFSRLTLSFHYFFWPIHGKVTRDVSSISCLN